MPCGHLVLLFLLPLVTANCVDFASQGTCNDSVCYATSFQHEEGAVHRLGCLSSFGGDSLDCEKLLVHNGNREICVESGKRKVCCCDGKTNECNKQWEPRTLWPNLPTSEIIILIMALSLVVLTPLMLNRFLPAVQEEQLAAEVVDNVFLCEKMMFTGKLTLFGIFLLATWLPVVPDCANHKEGEFMKQMIFISQAISNPFIGILLLILPYTCIIWDILRFNTAKQNGIPFRFQSAVSLALSGFLIIHLVFFFEEAVKLWKREHTTRNYCKISIAVWQAMAAGVLLSVYILFLFVQEMWLWRLRKINKNLLFLEAEEANCLRDYTSVACEENPLSVVETALSNTTIKEEDHIDISPRPFSLDSNGEGILTITNLHVNDWIAIRILCSIPNKYSIHPSKLVLPPLRVATVSVRYLDIYSADKQPGLMIQWFAVGHTAPPMDATRIWQKPHLRHRSEWKFFVLPIYHEL